VETYGYTRGFIEIAARFLVDKKDTFSGVAESGAFHFDHEEHEGNHH
jgi:hypothetical protein